VEIGSGNEVWAQADRLVFADGVVRVTDEAIVAGNEGATLIGGAGDDTLWGGMGADRLYGGDGDDTLAGSAGDDVLVSQSGADTLLGGSGDDVLAVIGWNGPAASEVSLWGGRGADVFALTPIAGGGAETAFNADVVIEDFEAGVDAIDVSSLRVQIGDATRALQIDDLLDAIVSQDEASATFDLANFVSVDGEALQGTLSVHLAAGEDLLVAENFIFDAASSPVDSSWWGELWSVA
jgi:Ca2+-binding RTX toxin-like protein